MQSLHEGNKSGDLGWTKVLAVSRHVSTTLNHLTHKLIRSQARRDLIKRRSTPTSRTPYAVAVNALFGVEDEYTLPFERCAVIEKIGWYFNRSPRIHFG
jgi:hypothetical protein